MKSISNKTIMGILTFALFITIIGTGVSIFRLGGLGDVQITGAATNDTTGTATLTVSSQTEITLQVTSLAFGSGYVNTTGAGCSECVMDTITGFYAGNESCCSNFNNVTAGFLIENTGNENVSVNFTCSGTCTAAGFINGTSPVFQFRMSNSSDGYNGTVDGTKTNNSGDGIADSSYSCSSGSGGWNYSEWTDVAEATFDLCGSNSTTEYYLASDSSRDAAVLDIKLSIPDNALTGSAKTATITFAAASAG